MTNPSQPSEVNLSPKQELSDLVRSKRWLTSNSERLAFLEQNSTQTTPIIVRYFSLLRQLRVTDVPSQCVTDYGFSKSGELFAELNMGEHGITYDSITSKL
jgi:hypothetical protein